MKKARYHFSVYLKRFCYGLSFLSVIVYSVFTLQSSNLFAEANSFAYPELTKINNVSSVSLANEVEGTSFDLRRDDKVLDEEVKAVDNLIARNKEAIDKYPETYLDEEYLIELGATDYVSDSELNLASTSSTANSYVFTNGPFNRKFLISAYYSPLPCQNYYVTGSYEGDMRLNGRGVAGADGTGVYPGMIAAPKEYPFGTKINIPGLGTGTVHDRGGAIVSSHKSGYDRLDVWFGYGDVGLKRAMNWGKRVVDSKVYGVDSSIPDTLVIPGYSTSESTPNCESQTVVEDSQVTIPEVYEENEPEPVEDFEINTSSDDANLQFGNDIDPVTDLSEEIISKNVLNQVNESPYPSYDIQVAHDDDSKLTKSIYVANNLESESLKATEVSYQRLNSELDPGIYSDEVRILQSILKDQGFFKHPHITNYYGDVTRQAVLNFQIAKGIVSNDQQLGAGRVGPATLRYLNSL